MLILDKFKSNKHVLEKLVLWIYNAGNRLQFMETTAIQRKLFKNIVDNTLKLLESFIKLALFIKLGCDSFDERQTILDFLGIRSDDEI